MEDLRAKNTQIESELEKLAGEIKEVNKRQEEALKKNEEGNRRMEERLATLVTNQVKHANRGVEDKIASVEEKLSNLTVLMEKSLRFQTGKGIIDHEQPSENIDNQEREEAHKKDNSSLNEEEYEWALENTRQRERGSMRTENHKGGHISQLPRIDFPHFDGEDPVNWLMDCNHYFEMYQVEEGYKTRMTVMHFSIDVKEWYKGINKRDYLLPWNVLVEKVFIRFKGGRRQHPIEEFKRCHQVNKVEEYVKQFERIRSRVLQVTGSFSEEDLLVGFISGLREDIRGMVKLLKPPSLGDAYEYALQYEETQDSQNRRMRMGVKHPVAQNNPVIKRRPDEWRRGGNIHGGYKGGNNIQNKMSLEQKRALGLC